MTWEEKELVVFPVQSGKLAQKVHKEQKAAKALGVKLVLLGHLGKKESKVHLDLLVILEVLVRKGLKANKEVMVHLV